MMRSYSSAVRPWATASSRVTLGSPQVTPPPIHAAPGLPLEEGAVLDQAAEERLEDQQPVGSAQRALGGSLGMRHQPQDVALFVDDPGDVVQRPVGVRLAGDLAVLGAVPEDDLVLLAQG